jgi:hypothetical protein
MSLLAGAVRGFLLGRIMVVAAAELGALRFAAARGVLGGIVGLRGGEVCDVFVLGRGGFWIEGRR